MHVGPEVFTAMDAEIARLGSRQIYFLVDENTHKHCLPTLLAALPSLGGYEVLEVEPGEASKDAEIALNLWGTLAQLGADRNTLLINVGGGVVTDLGGFVAATYKRGIPFWHVPTSLLGMVDAAFGGKTGVDVEGIKNLAGTFSQPNALFVYPDFLKTLPKKQLRSGMAEVFKHGLIADKLYWESAKIAWKKKDFASVVAGSISIKIGIVAQDEKEGGLRKLLNFGHTLGHAIESFYLQKEQPILHGDAVAAGMIMAVKLSVLKADLPAETAAEIVEALANIYPRLRWQAADDEHILSWLAHDKKNLGQELRFVLLRDVGTAIFDVPVTLDEAAATLAWYRETVAK